MYPHTTITPRARESAFNAARQELLGAPPPIPGVAAEAAEGASTLAKIIRRNAAYMRASPPYLRAFGKSQTLRNLHDGAHTLPK